MSAWCSWRHASGRVMWVYHAMFITTLQGRAHGAFHVCVLGGGEEPEYICAPMLRLSAGARSARPALTQQCWNAQVAPITMYNSDFALEQRRQIAVNGRYICYALRQGQLRVLHRQSAERALLKSKGAAVTDVQCACTRCCPALVLAPHSFRCAHVVHQQHARTQTRRGACWLCLD